MFFSGDGASRRKVELRGRSSKESDRNALVDRVRGERQQRLQVKVRQQSASRIQKFYRGRREVRRAQALVRQEFVRNHGEWSDRASRDAFKPGSKYLPELLYFLSPANFEDFMHLAGACRHFCSCLEETGGDVLAVVTSDYMSERGAVNYRVRELATLCLQAIHSHREALREELLEPADVSSKRPVPFVVAVLLALAGAHLPWAAYVIDHLARSRLFHLLRDLLLTAEATDMMEHSGSVSCLQLLVQQLSVQCMRRAEYLKDIPFSWGLSAQIFSIPLLWQRAPALKQVSINEGLWEHVIHQSGSSSSSLKDSLPPDTGNYPSVVCLLGNLLEVSRLALAQKSWDPELVTEVMNLLQHLMGTIPLCYHLSPLKPETIAESDDDEEMVPVETNNEFPDPALAEQLQHASTFLKDMARLVFTSTDSGPIADVPKPASVGAICGFLYTTFSVSDRKTVISGLAYNANFLPSLWRYIQSCYTSHNWPAIQLQTSDPQLTPGLLGWMLPLVVFSPVFSHMLFSLDNDEFHSLQHPLTIEEVVQLVHILKEGLWQLLWVLHCKPSTFKASDLFCFPNMRQFLINVTSALLAELHDRNGKRQFAPPEVFHAREAIDNSFFQQEGAENTKVQQVLAKAPFLIPFTSRFRVYSSQLASLRENNSPIHSHSRQRIKVQRNRIVEDAFSEFSHLTTDELRDTIRVSYLNELGVEEAGVDGGGLFKDFMETVTKAAFDLQYGLFKETADHLLYPNPASRLVNENHLQYFEFLGKILGKAMFEGILVDIPFATFFLRKLRNKHNYLHDLPSLDPELYKNLLYLKNNISTVSQLDLYFVIEDNEYGQQLEVELLPGGKDIQVTSENVFRYIHLVANHRLNHQMKDQSRHFLSGFQQLISPELLDMFNEHELQIIISGSEENTNIDDLQGSTQYGGGYSEDHPVICMFWEVLKTMDTTLQQKFIKFVTGCSRGPLLGFKYLEPQFCIQKTVEEANDEERLPTSATCMNLLKLPPYKSKEMIREKLIYAITSGAGFDLS